MFILMFYLQKNTFENMNKAKNLILSYFFLTLINLITQIMIDKICKIWDPSILELGEISSNVTGPLAQ